MSEIMSWEWGGPIEETLRPRRRKNLDEEDNERGMPLPPMSPLWREHGKGQPGGGIHIVICCCNEEEDELNVALSTFRTDSPASCPVRVSFILDSRNDDQANSETYAVLKRKLRVTADVGPESFGEFGCIHHSGTLDKTQVPFDLYVKDPSLPAGKRNSLVIFFDEILPVKISRGEALEPDVVYLLDADSGHPANGLQDLDSMWRLLMVEDEAACMTCPIRPVYPLESFLASAQFLEYALWDNVGESHFALQTTCRGAQCMFKYRCLVEDGRLAQPPVGEGAMPPLLDSFSKTAAGIPALILLDTSPSEGLLVLLRQRDFDVRSCGVVDGVTCVPNSWLEFYAQRRRWYAGSMLAVTSHLTGKEGYFQLAWCRWMISSYAVLANLYLHCGLAFLPVLLAKGIYCIADYTDSRGESEDEQGDSSSDDETADQEWVIFALVWAFLLLNAAVYLTRSQDQLWMWINVTSVLWMVLCLVALIGSAMAVSPYIPIAVVVVPVVWAGLNSSMGMHALGTWCYLVVAAVPFVLLTAVNSVLVFLYSMATLDSGVSKSRAASMRRRKLCIMLTVMAISCGVGILVMLYPTYTLLPVVVGVPLAAYALKLLLVIFPARLERSRQRMLLGDAGHRPLSLRRNMSEMAPIHGRTPEYRTDRQGPSSRTSGRSRKGSALQSPTEISSHVTKDGTPSPGDIDGSASGSFFAAGASVGCETMSGVASGRPGHRRHSSSASMSSGFAGVAGVGGGGIGGGSVVGAQSTRSVSSRRSSAGSKTSSRDGSRAGSKDGSRAGSREGIVTGSTGSRSRSRSRSPPARRAEEEAPETVMTDVAGKGGRVARAVGSGTRAAGTGSFAPAPSASVQGNAPKVPKGARRTGFAQFLSAKDSVEGVFTGATPPRSRPASGRKTTVKADIRKAWGLRETMESDDSIQMDAAAMEAFELKANGNRGGIPGARRGWGFGAPSPPKAQVKGAATAPVDAGVKRYSWARKRTSTSDFDVKASAAPEVGVQPKVEVPPRTPERDQHGARTYLARSSMGSEDDIHCPSPAAINAILNSRIGATRRGDVVDEYARGVVRGSRRQPAGAALVGIRAAWGSSMGGSQDDIGSPSAMNAGRNSGLGGVYATGVVDEYDENESETDFAEANQRFHSSQRRPGRGGTLAGARAAWGSSMGGSQDDIGCPRPVANSGAGAASYGVHLHPDDDSESEADDGDSRSLVPRFEGSRRRPMGNTLAGIRAAWGTSMGGSQDDMACPSPATVNAILNSRVGAVYSRGGDGGSSASAGIGKGRGPPIAVSEPVRRPRNEHRAVGGGSVSTGRGQRADDRGARGVRGGGGGGGGGAGGRANPAAGTRGEQGERGDTGKSRGSRRNPGGVRGETARGRDERGGGSRGVAGAVKGPGGVVGASGVVQAAPARRNWGAGQSSVFDSSGSSSSEDEGKPRGLRGVQVLDPEPPGAEIRSRSSGSGGGGAAGSSGGAGGAGGAGGGRANGVGHAYRGPGGGGRANGVGHAYRGPGGGVPGVGSMAGDVTTTGGSAATRVPRLGAPKGTNQESNGEYSFEQRRA